MNTHAALGLALSVLASLPAQAQLQVQWLVPGGTALHAADTLDFDGDGDLDLFVVLDSGFGGYRLLANDGAGGFTDVSAGRVPFSVLPASFCVCFDCDGDQDLDVFTGGNQGAELLLDTGGGTFVVAASFAQMICTSAAAGDLDQDGDLDLAVSTLALIGGTNRILVNNGSGAFSLPPPMMFGGTGGAVHLVDFDDDLDLDLLFAGNAKLLRNDGALTFTDVSATALPSVLPTAILSMSCPGDLDGDGDTDFVVSFGGVDQVLLDQGNSYALAGALPTFQRTFAITCADLDGDGDLDVVRSHLQGPLSVALNDGIGTFVDGASRLPPFPIWSDWVRGADFDRDGDVDLMTAFSFQGLQLRNLRREVEPLAAVRGQSWNVGLWSEPGYAIADAVAVLGVALARLPSPIAVPPLGELAVDLTTTVLTTDLVTAAQGVHWYSFAIPASPVLQGLPLHSQGVVLPVGGVPHFTACRTVVIQ